MESFGRMFRCSKQWHEKSPPAFLSYPYPYKTRGPICHIAVSNHLCPAFCAENSSFSHYNTENDLCQSSYYGFYRVYTANCQW